jgi:hypothetical protein
MTARPDPNRIGGWEWTQRTKGRLTRGERLQLLAATVNGQRDFFLHRLRRARPSVTPRPGDRNIRPPDSRFAREVEAAAAEQNPVLITHGYRSWIYGRALAAVDGVKVDEELLFAGALLHDHGIEPIVPGEDFTLRSAQRATECAHVAELDDDRTFALADAITVHTTPGITIERDGALGYYIQNGALVDIAGNRIWDLSQSLIDDTLARYDRKGFTRGLGGHFTAEAKAVPGGRFSMLRRCGFVGLMHIAPFDKESK